MIKYLIELFFNNELVHSESFFASDIKEAVRNLSLRSNDLTNKEFDRVILTRVNE